MMTREERRETDGQKGDKVSPVELIKLTAYVMMGREQGDGWARFPLKLVIKKHPTADVLYYEMQERNVLRMISPKHNAQTILRYWQMCPATVLFKLTPEHARMAVEFFTAFADSFEYPIEPVMFDGDIGYTFYRLPFDPAPGPTPTFDELMGRMSNPVAFKAFIGSLFDSLSERQQYLYLYGVGGNGKSRIAQFFRWLFGNAACSTTVAGHERPFWTSQFMDKRLVIFPDTDNFNFMNTGLFKSLTGGDSVRVELKGSSIFDAQLMCKFVLLSNQKPHIEDDPSAVRRALYCELGTFEQKNLMPDHCYDALLKSEAYAFVYDCIQTYKLVSPQRGAIPNAKDALDAVIADAEERWEVIVRKHFHVWPKGYFDAVDDNKRPMMEPVVMQEICNNENLKGIDLRRFKAFLERTYGVEKKGVKVGLQISRRRYLNCTLKSDNKNYAHLQVANDAEIGAQESAT